VASRLEERRNKKRRKEELNNSSTEKKTEHNIPKSETNYGNNEEKSVDGSPPSCKDEEIDDVMIKYDLPPIISVPVSSVMRDEMSIGKSEKYLFFETKDNDGKGNCFYNSILNSNAFSLESKIDCDYDYDSLLAMREDLQRFAIENEDLSNLIFDLEVDRGEQKEWAGKLLVEAIKFHEKEDFRWIIENLKKDKLFSEMADQTTSSVVLKTLEIQCMEDTTYTECLVETHFTHDEVKKMAKQWWLKSIGTDLEWAGRPEMLLFSLKYQKNLVILSNRVGGPQVDGTNSMIELMRSDIKDLVQIPKKSTFRETIYLWAFDPHNPLTPLELCDQTQHFVTLNMIHKKHLLTKKKKANAFYFDAFVDNDKKRKGKKNKNTVG
jgi:hypothetical protein